MISITLPGDWAGLFEYVERPLCASGCDIALEWVWVFCPLCGTALFTE